jgi:hypothetical protein
MAENRSFAAGRRCQGLDVTAVIIRMIGNRAGGTPALRAKSQSKLTLTLIARFSAGIFYFSTAAVILKKKESHYDRPLHA